MGTVKTSMGVSAMVAFVVVVLNGLGLHAMGLRHTGAHILVEFGGAFLGVLGLLAVRAILDRTHGAGSSFVHAPRVDATKVADRFVSTGQEVDPDAGTTAWTPKRSGVRA